MNFWQYVVANYPLIWSLLVDHVTLTGIAIGISILIGVPLGIFISYSSRPGKAILSLANIAQAIPSMALLGFMIPLLGIGTLPAIVAVVIYSQLPIIKNTYTGIEGISPETLEAARGIGLTPLQILTKVQIPLALPMIMAGVRIAAVTAVGLMTIAAFIGAGGLGYLVFSGIRTVNTNQILAGAIPACILALTVDYFIAFSEKIIIPISLQKNALHLKKRQTLLRKVALAVIAVLVVSGVVLGITSPSKEVSKMVTIGTKDYTEQMILGNMAADIIEARSDISVNRRINLGGTQVCFGAMKTGDIDMYVEYTGTIYIDTLKHPSISDTEEVYRTIKKELKDEYDIETLAPLNFNNTYTLAVKQETARKYNLDKVSDLTPVASAFTSGTTFEFSNRVDGLNGLEKKYRFEMGKKLTIDGSPRYLALKDGEVDVIDAFSTDGLLKKFNLHTLRDDKNFFPPYYAVPIINAKTLAKYPEIEGIMLELGSLLNNDVMVELNYEVDELEKNPEDVAREFLIKKGIIK